jgi:hypothetical protein
LSCRNWNCNDWSTGRWLRWFWKSHLFVRSHVFSGNWYNLIISIYCDTNKLQLYILTTIVYCLFLRENSK